MRHAVGSDVTSDQIMRRVSELVELARKETTAITMAANEPHALTGAWAHIGARSKANEATERYLRAFEAFENEVAEPMAAKFVRPTAKEDRPITLDEAIVEAKSTLFGEVGNERLDSFLACEAFENRFDPDNRARAFRLAAVIVSHALSQHATTARMKELAKDWLEGNTANFQMDELARLVLGETE